jgi:hypothetical protein
MIDVVFPDTENCPDCGGFIFRPGPQARGDTGPISRNIECVGCGSRFNVTRFDHNMSWRGGKMPIVWAHRIPSEADGGGEWREDMFPRVLQ